MEEPILRVLESVGAMITDSHVIYESGLHGRAYVNKDALFAHVGTTSSLCKEIARRFRNEGVEAVIGPAIGGVILSQWVAHHLSHQNAREVISAYAEKHGDDFVIKRGYDKLIDGRRVLVVEDVITTGRSLRKVVQVARHVGGIVIGAGILCNRGGVTSGDLDVSWLDALVNVPMEAWAPENCPLCKEGVPINTDVGHGVSK